MTRSRSMSIVLVALCAFAAGWLANGAMDDGPGRPGPRLVTTASAQPDSTRMDPNAMALAMGVASVAVDTEATAQRLNDLADRLAALERRVQTLEKTGNR